MSLLPAAAAAAFNSPAPAWQPRPSLLVAVALIAAGAGGRLAGAASTAISGSESVTTDSAIAPAYRGRMTFMSCSASSRLSRCVVNDFEGGFVDYGPAAHVLHGGRLQHDSAPDHLALEQSEQAVLRQRRGADRRRQSDIGGEFLEQGAPLPARQADDFIIRALLADVVVGRDRGKHGNADRLRKGRGLTATVVLVDDHAGDADIAAELAEIFHRGADIIGDVKRLQIVRSNDDDLLAHVARDRQAETAADHVAQEVQQHVVEAPFVKAELFEELEAVDDAAPPAAAADFRTAELHGEHAVALEADVADFHFLAGELFLRGGLDDGRTGATAKQKRRGVALRIATDQQHLLALLRHHVRQVGEGETLADAALAVDRNDLRLLGHGRRHRRIRLDRSFRPQFVFHADVRHDIHESELQFRTIFRHAGSSNAIG